MFLYGEIKYIVNSSNIMYTVGIRRCNFFFLNRFSHVLYAKRGVGNSVLFSKEFSTTKLENLANFIRCIEFNF